MLEPHRVRIELGSLLATANALAALDPESIPIALARHARGDWGDIDDHDRQANNEALRSGDRLLSVYHDRNGRKFYVITEANREVTTVLLPEDY